MILINIFCELNLHSITLKIFRYKLWIKIFRILHSPY